MRAREQRRKRRPPTPFRRELHFPQGDVWTYRVTSGLVLIRSPDLSETFRVPLTEVTGMSWDDLERGQWKRWWEGLGPQEVKDYVEHHLRPGPQIELPPTVFVRLPPWGSREKMWHLQRQCHFLPQKTEDPLFKAWKQVRALDPEEAAARLGEPLTRRNLCGPCMHRVHVRKEAIG